MPTSSQLSGAVSPIGQRQRSVARTLVPTAAQIITGAGYGREIYQLCERAENSSRVPRNCHSPTAGRCCDTQRAIALGRKLCDRRSGPRSLGGRERAESQSAFLACGYLLGHLPQPALPDARRGFRPFAHRIESKR